jgi:hypothetical protein
VSGFDLSAVTELAESLMIDQCIVKGAPDADTDRVWNESTGEYEDAAPATKYEGKCQIWSARQGAFNQPEGLQNKRVSTWYVEIPKGDWDIGPECTVTVTAVTEQGNEMLVDYEMKVVSIDLYTYSVSVIMKCEIWTEVPQ